jgi:phage terminase large subunit
MVAGFGAGKTHAAVWRSLVKKFAYPKQDVAYYLPTYDLVTRTGYPRFGEILDALKVRHVVNKNDAVINIRGMGAVIFRTMDNPARIVSYEVADSLVDELDTLVTAKAADVWNKVISRNRQKKPDGSLNTVGVATTPEGFRFVYERWKKNPVQGYRLIKATTQSNAKNLPAGYIESLSATYPSQLLAAYLDGEFVNLTAGSVYPDFDRKLNASAETIKDNEPLHIGLDFNVTKMAAVVFVLRDGKPHAVKEYTKVFDTPAMCELLKSRHKGHAVIIYPDASGGSRKSSNASVTDLQILRASGFTVCVPSTNPAVKDRVLTMNNQIRTRDFRVNPDACPELVESLEKQAYDKNGEPDKAAGLDHLLDAAGYFISYKFPVSRPVMRIDMRTAY